MFYEGLHVFTKPTTNARKDLKERFKTLTPQERVIYASHHLCTLREIAGVMGISHTKVSRLYMKGREKLDGNAPQT